jgi:hypothetical protein
MAYACRALRAKISTKNIEYLFISSSPFIEIRYHTYSICCGDTIVLFHAIIKILLHAIYTTHIEGK